MLYRVEFKTKDENNNKTSYVIDVEALTNPKAIAKVKTLWADKGNTTRVITPVSKQILFTDKKYTDFTITGTEIKTKKEKEKKS